MFWVEILPASIYFVTILFIPESPRYLVASGRIEEAKTAVGSLSKALNIDEKIADITSTLHTDRKPRLGDVISKVTSHVHPIVWAGIVSAALQQFTGTDGVCH